MRTGRHPKPSSSNGTGGPTFVVERFGWGAPDRLEVAGTFSGLAAGTPGGAVLTVIGEDGAHRLPAIGHGENGSPADGALWAAEFAWLEAPVAFDRARLELGESLGVDLPAPGTATDGDPLAVELLEEAGEEGPPASDEPPEPAVVGGAAERLRLETQLLDQAELLEEARNAAQRAEAALERAESDLAAEREARAADAERFHEGLAQVRASAEEALAAAADERARKEELAQAELAELRERITNLEPASAERDEARAELDALRGELDDARGALAAAQDDAQALVDRLAGRR